MANFAHIKMKTILLAMARRNEYGLGVWDQETGKQVDFFYESPGWSLGDADKLQWLQDSNFFMAATLFQKGNCYISLLDLRSKSMVWCSSDHGAHRIADEKSVLDAVAMEASSSVWW